MEQLSILMLKEDNAWVAQCLEFDIAGQGESIKDAMVDFMHTFVLELALSDETGSQGLEDIPPAPKYYWRLYRKQATPVIECEENHPLEINTSEIPEPFMLPQERLKCIHAA